MNKTDVLKLIKNEKLIVIARRVPTEKLKKVADAISSGGAKILELTFDQTADDPIKTFTENFEQIKNSGLCIGAGTVLTVQQLKCARKLGAEFFVAPNSNPKLIKLAKKLGMVAIPGALTPSEIVNAYESGADIVKLFPADDMGLHYLWNLSGPLNHIPLLVSGGVNVETIPQYLKHGASALCTGVTIIDRTMLNTDDYEGIKKLTEAHINSIKNFSDN